MYTTPEQKQFSAAYDQLLLCTEAVLTNPSMALKLGQSATEIQILLHDTFLPNIRNGVLSIPNSEKGNNRIAVVPTRNVTNEALTSPLMDEPIARWPVDHPTRNFMILTVAKR